MSTLQHIWLLTVFTHADVGAPGLGDSDNEFDTIDFSMNLDLDASILAFFFTAGLSDNFDVGVAIPHANVSMKAHPIAQVNSCTFVTNDTANHSFGSTPTDPQLTLDECTIDEDATGSDLHSNEIELFLGYDQKLADSVTLAVDFMREFEVGNSVAELQFPWTAVIQRSIGITVFRREVSLTNIPNFARDHNVNASFGLNYNPREEIIFVGNVILPLNDGGLRSDFISTVGFQVGF